MTFDKLLSGSSARANSYLAVVCLLGAIALWLYTSNAWEERMAARAAAEDAAFDRALLVGCYAASAKPDAPVRTIRIKFHRVEDNLGNSFLWKYSRGKPDTLPHTIALTGTSPAWSYLPTDRFLMFTDSSGRPMQDLDHKVAALSVGGTLFRRSAGSACATN